jgi:hypothetical protein
MEKPHLLAIAFLGVWQVFIDFSKFFSGFFTGFCQFFSIFYGFFLEILMVF